MQKIGCHGNVPWDIEKRGSDRSSTPKMLSFDVKIAKIGPVDPEVLDQIGPFFGRVIPDVLK